MIFKSSIFSLLISLFFIPTSIPAEALQKEEIIVTQNDYCEPDLKVDIATILYQKLTQNQREYPLQINHPEDLQNLPNRYSSRTPETTLDYSPCIRTVLTEDCRDYFTLKSAQEYYDVYEESFSGTLYNQSIVVTYQPPKTTQGVIRFTSSQYALESLSKCLIDNYY